MAQTLAKIFNKQVINNLETIIYSLKFPKQIRDMYASKV